MNASANRYVVITGVVFALITIAHIARVAVEGAGLARDPFFVLLTAGTAALSVWAWSLVSGARASGRGGV